MAKVHVEPDCGNAPKKLFIRDFMIATANNDASFILDALTDDADWKIVGNRSLAGKSEIENALDDVLNTNVQEMTIATIITHGDVGSADGTMRLNDGKRYGFCHVFIFNNHGKNAKVKQITSFVIKD
jgi:hypothetical protein